MQRCLLCVLTSQHFNPASAGLFFCLASAEGAGFLFCPAAHEPHTGVYSVLCVIHANYTASTAKAFTGLYSGVSVDLTYSSAHNTTAAQAAYTPPTPRWRAYRQAQHLHRYQTPPPRRTLYSSAQPPYYNNVYKGSGASCYRSMPGGASYRRPYQQRRRVSASGLHPVQGSDRRAFGASCAQRLAIWHRSAVRAHTPPSGAIQQRADGTTGGYRRISFRAFAR